MCRQKRTAKCAFCRASDIKRTSKIETHSKRRFSRSAMCRWRTPEVGTKRKGTVSAMMLLSSCLYIGRVHGTWQYDTGRGPWEDDQAAARMLHRDGFGSDTHGYEFGCYYLPQFRIWIRIRILSNTNTKRIFQIRIPIRILTWFIAES
jgi:hypothetical protein